MNAQEWLDLYAKDKNEFAVEAARLLTPGPWPHTLRCSRLDAVCIKCGVNTTIQDCSRQIGTCTVPPPLVIDWNTAMPLYQAGGCGARDALRDVWAALLCTLQPDVGPFDEWCERCGPEHLIIATGMVVEETK